MHTYICTHMHECMHKYIHIYLVHMYIHAYICTHIHACINTYIHTCIHTYKYSRIHMYIRTYMNTYLHTHIHRYKHILTHLISFLLLSQSVCTYLFSYLCIKTRAFLTEIVHSGRLWPYSQTVDQAVNTCLVQTLQLLWLGRLTKKQLLRGQCCNAFYGRNLEMVLIIQSVCPWKSLSSRV